MITVTKREFRVVAWGYNFGWKMPYIARILKLGVHKVRRIKHSALRKMAKDELARSIDCRYMYYGRMDKYHDRNHNVVGKGKRMTHRCAWEFLWKGAMLSSTAACMHNPSNSNYCHHHDCPYRDASYQNKWIIRLLYGGGGLVGKLLPGENRRVRALLNYNE